MLRRNRYRELEKSIGYRFRDKALLERALTHRSFRFEHAEVVADNQRLEFLGDAVLGLMVAAWLFDKQAESREGTLTALRSRVTSGKALAGIAREINLGEYLRIGRGEEQSGGRERDSILEDALEAVIGAAWLDGGRRASDKIMQKLFAPFVDGLGDDSWADNPKGELQELAQGRWKVVPVYEVTASDGPQHATVFTVKASVPGVGEAVGEGRSKRAAESAAAKLLLKKIKKDNQNS